MNQSRNTANQAKDLANSNKNNIIQVKHLAVQGAQAHRGLCAYKADLENRLRQSRQFLKTHPNGLPGLISPSALRVSIINQTSILNALQDFKCSKK